MELDVRQKIILQIANDRVLAHQALFKHRHPQKTPDFQRELVRDWHSRARKTIHLVFRGGGKSTVAEEAIVIKGAMQEFRNCIIVGVNADRARDRLHAVKSEIENNVLLAEVFGDLRGVIWTDDRITLSNGAMIQALGRGQGLRGIKHEEMRPDLIFADDIEDRSDMYRPETRKKVQDWFFLDLLPACDPDYECNVAATPLHPEALSMNLFNNSDWLHRKYPIKYLDDQSVWLSAWPERFSMKRINNIEDSYRKSGQIAGFMSEYMCEAEASETKAFKQDQLRVVPQIRTWQAVYSMTDPARTTSRTASDTGHAVWSWIGPRLIIWDGWARQLMPNEIVDAIFKTVEDHHPIWCGVEEDGLSQFLMQPIRMEGVKRGISLPIKAVHAPNSKLDFIRGLQPFFLAGEVEFAQALPDLRQQLLDFPSGRLDAPNALAYALRMRPGAPLYDDFRGDRHVSEDITIQRDKQPWLCINATRAMVTAMLVQVYDGSVRVFADWVYEGEPQVALPKIISETQLLAGRRPNLMGGPLHFDQYNNVGLRQAATRIPFDMQQGVVPSEGRSYITNLLQREASGRPMLMVSSEARWTLNALAGGYSRALKQYGQLADYAEEGPYKTLMEGLESFCGLLQLRSPDREDEGIVYARTPGGQRYVTARR